MDHCQLQGWLGEGSGRLHPTLVRRLWRSKGLALAANLDECDPATRSRWGGRLVVFPALHVPRDQHGAGSERFLQVIEHRGEGGAHASPSELSSGSYALFMG